jgi:hypothetical protein
MNVVAAIGHNNPPLSPFESHRANIDDLYAEAKNWCDGDPITTQPQADEVSRLLGMIREAESAADASRKDEAKPYDDAKAEIQERYNLLIGNTKTVKGKTVLAAEACKAALLPFLKAQEAEREAIAKAAREEADRKVKEASAAAQAAAGDLEAMEQAEALIASARKADKAASKVENSTASAAGLNRAVSLRTYWSAEVTDLKEACRHYWSTNPDAFMPLIAQLANTDVLAGKRTIPGVKAVSEQRPV